MARNFWSSISNINDWRLWLWKKNALLNPTNNEPDIDKICLYAKYPYEAKYQLLINKIDSTVLKHFNGSKSFIEYTAYTDMDDIYKIIEEYNPNRKRWYDFWYA